MNLLTRRCPGLASIRWRLTASYLLLTLLIVTMMALLTLSLVEHGAIQRERQQLAEFGRALAERAPALLQPVPDAAGLAALVQETAAQANCRVIILDAGGQPVVHVTPPERTAVWVLRSAGGEAEPEPHAIYVQEGELPVDGQPLITAHVPATRRSKQEIELPVTGPGGEALGTVKLSEGPDLVSGVLGTAREALFPAALAAAAAAVIVGLWSGHRLASPLEKVTRAAARMGAGNLAVRAPEDGVGEVGGLARQFNAMARLLEGSFADLAAERDALRNFVADASHELRTPITALQTFNELLQDGAVDEPEARDRFLAESQAQVQRLTWIVHNLLDLSRLDAGLVALDLAPCALGELVERVAAAFAVRVRDRGQELGLDLPPRDLLVECDGARLEMALANLLDNACKYTPRGGALTVGAGEREGCACLWVWDTGPGVAAQDVPHLFRRFARGGDGGVEGTGLGLSIARRIVEAHGGRATVESAAGQGSTFFLILDNSRRWVEQRPG